MARKRKSVRTQRKAGRRAGNVGKEGPARGRRIAPGLVRIVRRMEKLSRRIVLAEHDRRRRMKAGPAPNHALKLRHKVGLLTLELYTNVADGSFYGGGSRPSQPRLLSCYVASYFAE